jgi:hypothetical protein
MEHVTNACKEEVNSALLTRSTAVSVRAFETCVNSPDKESASRLGFCEVFDVPGSDYRRRGSVLQGACFL